eukprot:3612487-Amphidinium_carterae.1
MAYFGRVTSAVSETIEGTCNHLGQNGTLQIMRWGVQEACFVLQPGAFPLDSFARFRPGFTPFAQENGIMVLTFRSLAMETLGNLSEMGACIALTCNGSTAWKGAAVPTEASSR